MALKMFGIRLCSVRLTARRKVQIPEPDDPFAVFRYGDYWYWIEQNDLESKRVFLLMLFLTTLTNRADSKMGPVLTIPTG